MGTGIVSIGFAPDGRETLSRILLIADGLGWLALGVLLVGRAARPRAHPREARSPAAQTGAAGHRGAGRSLTWLGREWGGLALLSVARYFWLVLLTPVLASSLRSRGRHHRLMVHRLAASHRAVPLGSHRAWWVSYRGAQSCRGAGG